MIDDMADDARRLWKARIDGTTLPPLASVGDEASAYAVQEALIAARNERSAGWKVGATGTGAPRALGLSGPLAGPLWAEFVAYFGTEPAHIKLSSLHRPQVEVEVAFRLSGQPASAEQDDMLASIDGVALALELTGSRLSSLTTPMGPGFVADHAGNGAVVIGPLHSAFDFDDLPELTATLTIAGARAGTGSASAVLGNPLNALGWLIGHLGARGHKLAAGQVVLTGAMVPMTEFPLGAELVGTSEKLRSVAVQTEDRAP